LLDVSDSSSLEELSSDDSDSCSLVDLLLISAPSLFLEDCSVRLLGDSSSEVNTGGFGLGLLFFADGVTLLFFEPFFDADDSFFFIFYFFNFFFLIACCWRMFLLYFVFCS
jgi:hypothetical protein